VADVEKIADRTAAEIGLAYRSGEVGPVAVTECLLDRIERAKADNIFITVTRDRALAEARAAEQRYRSGLTLSALDGVPIAWKDIFDLAGTRTTAGSKVLADRPAKKADAVIAANATRAGMVTVGKVNMTELAYSGLGLNPHFGTPVNPNSPDVRRAPGGSSSGSGTAVAARLVPVAIGSDTGGSVRIPSSFNGVVGYKSSPGRFAMEGVIPLARTYDTLGPLARSVEDCILTDRILRAVVAGEVIRADLGELTLVVPTNFVTEGVEPAVTANFERSLRALASAGVTVRREKMDVLDEVVALTAGHGTLTAAEAYVEFRDLLEGDRSGEIDRRVVKRMIDGKRMPASDMIAILRGRQRLKQILPTQLDGALMAWPTTPITAPEVAPLEASDETFHKVNLMALRNTMPGTILDFCGVAMPNGRDGAGMPTSFLLSGLCGEDERVLATAIEIERVLSGTGGS
jgi:aspartyl-tRNA(Asn)/glutamyl-tRNA(Gln) amidotransferase subunit A